jgi:hypothetical protein
MKELLVFAFCLIAAPLLAQIPNYEFEEWESREIANPENWVLGGNASITSDASDGSKAIRLENKLATNTFGYVANTVLEQPLRGGQAYSDNPLVLRIDAKYDLAAGDLAKCIMLMQTAGNTIATVELDLNGNSGDTFTRFRVPIQWVVNTLPDTVFFAMASNDFASPINGDGYVIIDNLSFETFGNAKDPITNPSFEEVSTNTIVYPQGWYTSDLFVLDELGMPSESQAVSSSTESHYGKSMLLQNTTINGGILVGLAITGQSFSTDFPPAFELVSKPSYLQGYYKFQPDNNDTGQIGVFLYKNGSLVGMGQLGFVSKVDEIRYFTVPINYFGLTPDSASILVSCSNLERPRGSQTKLWVDKLSFTNSIASKPKWQQDTRLYPNPATDCIKVSSSNPYQSFTVTNSCGEQVLSSLNKTLDVSSLASGVYYISCRNNEKTVILKFVKL